MGLIYILKNQNKRLKVTKGLLNVIPKEILSNEYLDQIDLDSVPLPILLEKAMQDNNEVFLEYLLKQGIKISPKLAQDLVNNAEGQFKVVFEEIVNAGRPKTKKTPKKEEIKSKKKNIAYKDNRTDEQKAAQFRYRKDDDGNITIINILDDSLYKTMVIPESIYDAKVTSIGISYEQRMA